MPRGSPEVKVPLRGEPWPAEISLKVGMTSPGLIDLRLSRLDVASGFRPLFPLSANRESCLRRTFNGRTPSSYVLRLPESDELSRGGIGRVVDFGGG